MKKNQGFTLVELLIGAVLSLIVFGGAISLFIASDEVTDSTIQNGELQETGTYALNLLTKDIMMHGYLGLATGEASTMQIHNNAAVSQDCTGEPGNNGTFPNASEFNFRTIFMITATGVDDYGCIPDAKAYSTILQIKRGLGESVAEGEEENTRYYIKSTPAGDVYFYAGNDQASLMPDAERVSVMEYQNYIYYVREESQGDITVPILARYQLEKDATAAASGGQLVSYDLVEGIEYINALMGVDSDNDGVANFYLPVSNMNDSREYWDESEQMTIVSAKLFVLARSIEPDHRVENNLSYDLGDRIYTPNGDKYRRMLFTNTVYIANKGLGWEIE
ncbi:prepilin-type cleavage/methylation domain-containing protein [Saccharobesus litoralis]|uniref:Prepilin-type cleavage/methylation domain-containing protein n=1 Tax=Saccharobesus litoralis TaxID=2172099 RepID=A0A2S0VWE6_9ALTE|nr:PilW family protein [Saccharobesus litoralis]AWB68538.1 prepilin-type cleavage/methylation domain-containing protein [Saccharobesus litoralis]